MTMADAATNRGIYAGKGLTVSGCSLNVSCKTSYQAINVRSGEFIVEDATLTANGECSAKVNSDYYPVKILGKSVVKIDSTSVYNNSVGGLLGSEFTFSDKAHVQISSSVQCIGCTKDGTNNTLVLTEASASDFYWRNSAGGSFNKKASDGNLTMSIGTGAYYFEYIGTGHVDFATPKKDAGKDSHSWLCGCKEGSAIGPVAVQTESCSCDNGGTPANCTQAAICATCNGSYGESLGHDYKVDEVDVHVCQRCGEFDTCENLAALVTTKDGKKKAYKTDEFSAAVKFAKDYPGSVLTMLSCANSWTDTSTASVDTTEADITIDLSGVGCSGVSLSVNGGKVTIQDSGNGGSFPEIKVAGSGTVDLESGAVGSVTMNAGSLTLSGGTAGKIALNGGTVTMSQTPASKITFILSAGYDLSRPLASVSDVVNLSAENVAIEMEYGGSEKYTLNPSVRDGKLYALFQLTELTEADITLENESGITYDGTAKQPSVVVKRVNGNENSENTYETLKSGTDYTISYSDNKDAGTASVTITGEGFYTGRVIKTFTIKQAAPEDASVDIGKRICSCRADYTESIDLKEYLPTGYGEIKTATVTTAGEVEYRTATAVANGVLTYTTKFGSAYSGTIEVIVSTTNYTDIIFTLSLETVDKGILTPTTETKNRLAGLSITEGSKIATLKLTDLTMTDERGAIVTGSLTWEDPDATPNAGTTSAKWSFTPDEDSDKYMIYGGTATITVTRKPSSGSGSSSGGSAATVVEDTQAKQDEKQDEKKDETTQPSETAKPEPKGTKLKTETGIALKVTSSEGDTPSVTYQAPPAGKQKKVIIPARVKVDGVVYRVTAIGKGAFAGNTSVKHISISGNIRSIGANAFFGCKSLKNITIKSKKLSAKKIADNAFFGIGKQTTVRVPKKLLKEYRELLREKGLPKTVKVKAIK